MNEIIFIVEEDPEGGYNARASGVSIFVQAETPEELQSNIRDAVRCHYDSETPNTVRLRSLLSDGIQSELIDEPIDTDSFDGLRQRIAKWN